MTVKQQAIVDAAIELFRTSGYHAISTKKIAIKADVSEALIFRHFTNKEGLLQAILEVLNEQTINFLTPIKVELDPKELLRKVIRIPFHRDQMDHWHFYFKINWELNLDHELILTPIKEDLIIAFTKLRYKEPTYETHFIMCLVEGLLSNSYNDLIMEHAIFENFLKKKYYLT